MVAATDLPVNADFEGGFAADAAGVAESVRLAVETGVAGLSIEDSTGDAARPLHDLRMAVERMRAARRAIDQAGGDTLLVGRAECFLVGRPDLAETIARLKAYAGRRRRLPLRAGHPHARRDHGGGRGRRAEARQSSDRLGERAHDARDRRARRAARERRRGARAQCAWGGFMRAAKLIAEEGRFDGFAGAASGADLNALFRAIE